MTPAQKAAAHVANMVDGYRDVYEQRRMYLNTLTRVCWNGVLTGMQMSKNPDLDEVDKYTKLVYAYGYEGLDKVMYEAREEELA